MLRAGLLNVFLALLDIVGPQQAFIITVVKLPSLELRRLRFDLISCCKMIFDLVDIDCQFV